MNLLDDARVANVRLPLALIIPLLVEGNSTCAFECVRGIPPGAQLVGLWVNPHEIDEVIARVQHESLAPVKNGEQIPILDVQLRTQAP